jgi:Mn-dependent DtxR family transcriptional regulator
VCIARALINDPRIVLADEPTGNLDAANEEIVMRLLRELHDQGRTIVMVTHDPVMARMADRRIELHHGRIASMETFSMIDELQIDEVLETIWVLEEHGESAEVDRMQVHGAVPVGLLVERMVHAGLVTSTPHPPEIHEHQTIHNPCHEELTSVGYSTAEGSYVVAMTGRGRQRAGDIIRRHRLTERLFTDSLHMENEAEIAEQACKFEHILSQEATDKICAFLGHPTTCPHGAPIPPGPCCGARFVQTVAEVQASRRG